MTAVTERLQPGADTVLEDLGELSRAWRGSHVITVDGGTWRAEPRGGGGTLAAGSAGGLWLALWDARDAR